MVDTGEFWSTDVCRGPDLVDDWQAMLSETHLPWRVSIPREPGLSGFEARARRWWVDDLALVDCECGPCAGWRRRRELAVTDGEFVVVLITRSGSETVSQGESEAYLRSGDAVAWDSTQPATFEVWEPLSKRSLLIPRAALDEVNGRSRMTGGVMLNGKAPATRLLTTYLDILSDALPKLGPGAVTAARNATLELFVGALRGDGETSTAAARPALRAVMDRYIERHLLDVTMTPADIANAHAVSVRTVHRVFNATGQTVSEVVRVRRLARAREELTDSDRPVAAIAHRWGFADTSHFSRTFKAQYGASPRDYRLSVRPKAGGTLGQVVGAQVQRESGSTLETGLTTALS
jgi:AraC family transcriptional regulator, positive regulator of tynA and feaB